MSYLDDSWAYLAAYYASLSEPGSYDAGGQLPEPAEAVNPLLKPERPLTFEQWSALSRRYIED